MLATIFAVPNLLAFAILALYYVTLSEKFGTWIGALLGLGIFWIARLALTRFKVGNLSKKVVLITGCDTGFGRLTTMHLSKEFGVKVLAACLTDQAVKELSSVKNVVAFKMDITKQETIDAALPLINSECPDGLWSIINNAGVLRGGIFEIQSVDDLKFQLNVNVIGMAAVTKALFPLVFRAHGRIVNIASVAGRFATGQTVYYNASKFAVEGLTDALRREVSMWGVKVILVEPGVMKTPLWDVPMSQQEFEKGWALATKEQQDRYGRKFFETCKEVSTKLINQLAGDPMLVVNALTNATTSAFPLTRYVVGIDANTVFVPLSYLPTGLSDILWALVSPLPKTAYHARN